MLLHILGLVGKGIGITLLAIVLILFLLLAALLFVPIRYRVSGRLEEDGAGARASLHWLLHIVSATVTLEKKHRSVVRIFGIPVYDNLRPKKQRQQKKQRRRKKQAKQERASEMPKHADTVTLNVSEQVMLSEPVMASEPKAMSESLKKSKQAGRFWKLRQKLRAFLKRFLQLFQKLIRLPRNILKKLQKAREKTEKWKETIAAYREFLEREEFKCAFALCKKQLFRIWKNIRPKKLKAEIYFGFEDPAVTGQILAYAGMLYPILGKDIKIRPDFEKTILEGRLFTKGRITLFVLLRVFLILYFDKNIKRLIRIWKKEEIKDGRK